VKRHRSLRRRHTGGRSSLVTVILRLLLLAAVVGSGTGAVAAVLFVQAQVNTAGRSAFVNELRVPPLAPSRFDAAGRRIFDLTAQEGLTEFQSGRQTRTWGVNGSYLGPTLRAARGEIVLIHLQNRLPVATTMHWHGMHLPARMDGGPHQSIASGAVWSPSWRVTQPAATLWYHPHPHLATEEHTYRGLAGMFILDDDSSGQQGLPNDYGVDDLPVVVQDKIFDESGQLQLRPGPVSPTGQLGSTVVVNGTIDPYHVVTSQRVRLRLLNASAARVYNFGFSDSRRFDVIATDGGLLPTPVERDRLHLSPGERAEIVVLMQPNERTVLRSYPQDLGGNFWDNRFTGGDDNLDILQLRTGPNVKPTPPPPRKLADVARLSPKIASRARDFQLAGVSINGRRMDHHRMDATVRAGSVERWIVTNIQGIPHNFHIHGVHFQILDVNGEQAPDELRGWKDTVFLRPRTTTTLLVRLPAHADPSVPYMFHCHLLQHEDRGMMGQFIVEPPA
jgi:FtsP/CotA-like multicopper oxidase with cupredoxin domain